MKKKKFLTPLIVLTIATSAIAFGGRGTINWEDLGFSFNSQAIHGTPNPEDLALEMLFRMVSSFEKEADKQDAKGNRNRANAFRNFFRRKALLEDGEASKLKSMAVEFSSDLNAAFNGTEIELETRATDSLKKPRSSDAYIGLLQRYRERLRSALGLKSPAFMEFTRNEIGRGLKKRWNEKSQSFSFGSSTVDYDVQNDVIIGHSVTYDQGSSHCGEEEGSCYGQQVYAILSSDLNGVIDYQDSGEVCGSDAELFLSYDHPSPSTYHMDGGHLSSNEATVNCSWQGYSGDSSSASVPVSGVGMGSVDFQVIATDSLPIDSNPNMGGGLRIFPDDNTGDDHAPGQGPDRRRIRVRAFLAEQIAGRAIYFKSFDIDDPSTDNVIDPHGDAGDDNNGNVNGHLEGELSVSHANTDSQGMAYVDLTVTMQPGDNFAIAASTVDNLAGVTVDGTNLRDGNGTLIDDNCDGTATICRSQMLTVWRRLHLEVDSMGQAQEDSIRGTLTESKKFGMGIQTLGLSVTNLEQNRFENGRLVINGQNGNRSFRVIDATYDTNTNTWVTTSNTNSSVTVINNGGTFSVSVGDLFTLYDDDDMDDDDPNLNGDDGDPVPRPDTALMQDDDVPCSDTFDANNCNAYVSAYVRPTYDLTGEDVGSFNANVDPELIESYRNVYFQNRPTEANESFWTVYLLGAYQFQSDADADPTEEGGTLGIVDSYNGEGASIFTEVNRPTEYEFVPNWQTRPVGRQFTSAHEIGHLFYGEHIDQGLMRQTTNRISPLFTNVTINKIRGGEFVDENGLTMRLTHP